MRGAMERGARLVRGCVNCGWAAWPHVQQFLSVKLSARHGVRSRAAGRYCIYCTGAAPAQVTISIQFDNVGRVCVCGVGRQPTRRRRCGLCRADEMGDGLHHPLYCVCLRPVQHRHSGWHASKATLVYRHPALGAALVQGQSLMLP
ncbi:uncharacterized protein B0H18DRAFT_456604 [Fomitopsis serialis]|uniref:uncharacterized protein n=1 Tax=Fomitopsis serialis TaxID=139415 RepID=UPI002007A625|nr:uncharacterized protein B0H18DRAFT_456604 [Neoantrodia serialis]KAH9923608.1 hypothetical protein B0H18DRAFT_456604 [Neoantrodia serialis]